VKEEKRLLITTREGLIGAGKKSLEPQIIVNVHHPARGKERRNKQNEEIEDLLKGERRKFSESPAEPVSRREKIKKSSAEKKYFFQRRQTRRKGETYLYGLCNGRELEGCGGGVKKGRWRTRGETWRRERN